LEEGWNDGEEEDPGIEEDDEDVQVHLSLTCVPSHSRSIVASQSFSLFFSRARAHTCTHTFSRSCTSVSLILALSTHAYIHSCIHSYTHIHTYGR
jgi:hypothetical protein